MCSQNLSFFLSECLFDFPQEEAGRSRKSTLPWSINIINLEGLDSYFRRIAILYRAPFTYIFLSVCVCAISIGRDCLCCVYIWQLNRSRLTPSPCPSCVYKFFDCGEMGLPFGQQQSIARYKLDLHDMDYCMDYWRDTIWCMYMGGKKERRKGGREKPERERASERAIALDSLPHLP